jgi:DNA-binding transcriptional ArsR family regulator
VAEAAEMFRLLADETRVRLVHALLDAELSVGQLAEVVGKPGPSVSQHLAKLRLARLVSTRRDGTFVYYRIDNDHVAQLVVDALRHAEHGRTPTPRHHLADPASARTGQRVR